QQRFLFLPSLLFGLGELRLIGFQGLLVELVVQFDQFLDRGRGKGVLVEDLGEGVVLLLDRRVVVLQAIAFGRVGGTVDARQEGHVLGALGLGGAFAQGQQPLFLGRAPAMGERLGGVIEGLEARKNAQVFATVFGQVLEPGLIER